ncbi:hypothetical protein BRETT_003078 [Brettanomyces bruxellensis]|uniref:Multicopper oxidase n=1 Tax=Dekkera bruxellensis TaxID=5007 RepID=A0A871RKR7_DEKBR|nr:uncharacterized protein BRETT_003078 [Brettanomyces bruxellensis]QOU22891.1 hypothetical protein BRETT_003078 [Brettanomyces bruxellensis]
MAAGEKHEEESSGLIAKLTGPGTQVDESCGNSQNVNDPLKDETSKFSFARRHWKWILFSFLLTAALAIGLGVGLHNRSYKDEESTESKIIKSVIFASDTDPNDRNNTWRLNTGENYTMNLNAWRADFGTSKDRHYYFNITEITEVNADNAVRNLTVINGQYPGPLIEANSGDTIYIHVNNLLETNPVSIHCHGLFYQGNPFDDGAVSINNCPIPAGGNYTYKVPTSKSQWGTYWYHSHWSTQYADGVFGPLVLHSLDEDQLLGNYTGDRVMMVNDYYHDTASTYLSQYLGSGNENNEPNPDDGLIDGIYSQSSSYLVPTNDKKFEEALNFDPNAKQRIRVVNSGFLGTFTFSVDGHKLSIIEADGTNTEPVEEDSVDISVAQRYSFFLERENNNSSNFWVHARFNPFCFAYDATFDLDVRSIITYNATFSIPTDQQTWEYHGGDTSCLDYDQTKLKTLNETVPIVANGSTKPDVLVNLDASFQIGEYQLDKGYFNKYTWAPFSNTSSMHETLYNSNFKLDGVQNYVEDQYILNFEKRGQIVDFVINNYDDGPHPFHLHGHKMWVIDISPKGTFSDDMYDDKSNFNLQHPVLRDTVTIGPFGYAVLRFKVDNPGVWPFHCHIGWHMEAGLLLQVEELRDEFAHFSEPTGWKDACGFDFKQ